MNDRQAEAQRMADVYARVTGSVRATYTIEERRADGSLHVVATATSTPREDTIMADKDDKTTSARDTRDSGKEWIAEWNAAAEAKRQGK